MQSVTGKKKDSRFISVGEALKAYRLSKGYSGKYVAYLINNETGRKMTETTVYRYELGKTRVTQDYLSDFCLALRINCNVRILKNGAIWLTALDGVKVSARMY